jgi:hypothetical protein
MPEYQTNARLKMFTNTSAIAGSSIPLWHETSLQFTARSGKTSIRETVNHKVMADGY